MKIFSGFFLAVTVIIVSVAATISAAQAADCGVPAKVIYPQIVDFCFLQFATDDIAHPGVQACKTSLSSIPDNCLNRTHLKTYRCNLLQLRELLTDGMTVDLCVKALETEGLFVRGCEYPFDEECIKRTQNKTR